MKKPLTFRQRLALQIHSATTMVAGTSFPRGFEAYAKAVVKTQGKRLSWDYR
jgi:hypothetical protein